MARLNTKMNADLDNASEGASSSGDRDDSTNKYPPLVRSLVPDGIVVSEKFWREIYDLFQDMPNHEFNVKDLSIFFAKKYKRSLGGQELFNKCHVRNVQELMCALPDVNVVRHQNHAFYKLVKLPSISNRMSYRDKLERINAAKKSAAAQNSDNESDIDESLEYVPIPDQPVELLPPNGRMPDSLRQKIYSLLEKKYQGGVEWKEFRNDFQRTYGFGINNQRECCMNEDQLFSALSDCIEMRKGELETTWIKPIQRDLIQHINISPGSVDVAPKNNRRDESSPITVRSQRSRTNREPVALQTETKQKASTSQKPPVSVRWETKPDSRMGQDPVSVQQDVKQKSAIFQKPESPKPEVVSNDNDIELLYEAVSTLKNWIDIDDLPPLFKSKYWRDMKLDCPLVEALDGRPEIFVFRTDNVVKARHYTNGSVVDLDIFSNPVNVVEFGIEAGTIYSGIFHPLQLEIAEELQVLISHVEESGEFYLQMASLERRYSDLTIDMAHFYDSDDIGKFCITEADIRVGFPCAWRLGQDWRRAKIVDFDMDSRNKLKVQVQDVDFGRTGWALVQDLRFLKRDFVEGRVPPCAMLARLANILPDPVKYLKNAKKTLEKYSSEADSIFIKVLSQTTDKRTPEVQMTAYYPPHKKLPPVCINEEMVKCGFAIYLTGAAQDRRSNDNDLTVSDNLDEEFSATGRTLALHIRCSNRLTTSSNEESPKSPHSSSSTTSDNAESFNRYGVVAMTHALRQKMAAVSISSETQRQNVFMPSTSPEMRQNVVFPSSTNHETQRQKVDLPSTSQETQRQKVVSPSASQATPSTSTSSKNIIAVVAPQHPDIASLISIKQILTDKLSAGTLTKEEKSIYESQVQQIDMSIEQKVSGPNNSQPFQTTVLNQSGTSLQNASLLNSSSSSSTTIVTSTANTNPNTVFSESEYDGVIDTSTAMHVNSPYTANAHQPTADAQPVAAYFPAISAYVDPYCIVPPGAGYMPGYFDFYAPQAAAAPSATAAAAYFTPFYPPPMPQPQFYVPAHIPQGAAASGHFIGVQPYYMTPAPAPYPGAMPYFYPSATMTAPPSGFAPNNR